jgi:hypothetical protein
MVFDQINYNDYLSISLLFSFFTDVLSFLLYASPFKILFWRTASFFLNLFIIFVWWLLFLFSLTFFFWFFSWSKFWLFRTTAWLFYLFYCLFRLFFFLCRGWFIFFRNIFATLFFSWRRTLRRRWGRRWWRRLFLFL